MCDNCSVDTSPVPVHNRNGEGKGKKLQETSLFYNNENIYFLQTVKITFFLSFVKVKEHYIPFS